MGTPAYMSPEQCDGKGLVDHRTDIYALGILLYEMLTGRVPFIGEGYGEVLVQHLTQKPLPPSQYRMLPPHVEIVVLKALEKRQDLRYPTMEEFMRAMADPVGYVEANGGLQGFLGRQLMPSTAPIELPMMRLTPAPMSSPNLTPPPGSIMPIPGAALQTIGGANSVIGGPAARAPSRVGFWIAGVVVIAAAVGAIVVLSQRGGGSSAVASGTGSGGSAAIALVGSGSSAASTGSDKTIPHDTTAPATPDVVDIALTSIPAGATILVDGIDQKAVTPTTLHLKKSSSPSMISFRLDGYVSESRQVRLDEGNTKEDVALDKRPAAGSDLGSAATGSGAGGGSAAIVVVTQPVHHTTPPVTPPVHHHTPVTPPPHGPVHHDSDGLAKPGDL